MLRSIDSRYLQPGFKWNFKQVDKGYYYPSVIDLKFVNGQQQIYDLKLHPWGQIKSDILFINKYVELERSMNGIDDELEDEFK